jgi:integrase
MPNSYIRRRVKSNGKPSFMAVYVSKDPATGRRVTSSQTFDKRGDAELWRRKQIEQEEKTGVAKLSSQRLGSFVEEWLDQIVSKKKETTQKSYSEIMRLYLLPALAAVPLSKITPKLIQMKIVNAMEKRGLSETTTRYAVTVLRIALKTAIAWRLIASNPASARGLEFAETEKAERKSMNPEEAQSFVSALDDDPFRVLYLTLLLTGARPSEAFALQWKNIKLDDRVIRIVCALRWTKDGEPVLGPPKTKKSTPEITIGAPLAAELRKHKLASGDKSDDALAFTTKAGIPLDRNNIRHRFLRIAKRADLEGFTLYSLRHTFATLQLDQGVPVKVVSERLGHKSVTN